ncbi:MAG: HD domain-containing phosphohydrolase [Planctomycetota bacterium]|jgi:hypothetical protein
MAPVTRADWAKPGSHAAFDALLQRQQKLIEIGLALSAEHNVERLLERILTEARGFANAVAGTLYVVENDALFFTLVQNEQTPSAGMPARTALPIDDTSIAGYVALEGRPLNLADVYDLDPKSPFRFNDAFDKSTGFKTRSMLAIPMRGANGVNGVIQLINARDTNGGAVIPFPKELETLCSALASQAAVALDNARLTTVLQQTQEEIIFRLSRAAEVRDTDTGEHVRRVAHYSRILAIELGVPDEEARNLMLASPMHDVGKIMIPDSILKKPGRLTTDERAEMERHALYGHQILAQSDLALIRLCAEVAATHHERWDGTGYPNGLAGEAIPLSGRITAVADVFDALTSVRCYKPAMPVEQALSIVRDGAGSHFDPTVVAAFDAILPAILEVRERYT